MIWVFINMPSCRYCFTLRSGPPGSDILRCYYYEFSFRDKKKKLQVDLHNISLIYYCCKLNQLYSNIFLIIYLSLI